MCVKYEQVYREVYRAVVEAGYSEQAACMATVAARNAVQSALDGLPACEHPPTTSCVPAANQIVADTV